MAKKAETAKKKPAAKAASKKAAKKAPASIVRPRVLGRGRAEIGAVGGNERPDGPRHPAPATGVAGTPRGGKRRLGQPGHLPLKPHARQPVAQHRIGVGRGDGGPGGEMGVMDLPHQVGPVDHHLRGPQGRRPVAGAAHQFLADGAVQKRDAGHVPASGRRRKGSSPRVLMASPAGTGAGGTPRMGTGCLMP